MNIIKNVLGRILALWAILVFVIGMFIIFLPMLMIGLWEEPKRSFLMQGIYRNWMRVFFALTGIRLKVKGRENFKDGENYIVVFNHNSFLDVPISVPFMPGANKTIAKIEMSRIPIFGILYKRGSVLVDRQDEESRKLSYIKMRAVLDTGLHMCIYPEGTRNKTDQPLQRFHDGAFRLARETGKPILPALIFNTKNLLPRKTFYFWPGKVQLHYLHPVRPDAFPSTEELKTHVFDLMRDYYITHQGIN